MITEPKKRDVALVVDDSPETLRLLTDALDGAGMTVMVALDGASAMRIVDQITPDIVLLDNMSPDQLRSAVARRNEFAPTVQLEASGGITPASLQGLGGAGLQFVSLGHLTHSAPALDLSMSIEALEAT